MRVLICSEKGGQIANDYLAIEKEKRLNCEQKVLDALRNHEFREASLLRSSFMAEQVFTGTMGIDWRNPKEVSAFVTPCDIATLEIISTGNPKILKRIKKELMEYLRLAAGTMYLWGERDVKKGLLPPNLETGSAMNSSSAARMIEFYARNQMRLVQCQDFRCKSVEISTANDGITCEACRKTEGKKYRIDRVPELPYEKCTCDAGCRCTYLPVVE